jgi:hypothetical protein
MNELGTNNKNKHIRDLYRGISKFKKGYQPRTNIVKDVDGDLLVDSHSILKYIEQTEELLLSTVECTWH